MFFRSLCLALVGLSTTVAAQDAAPMAEARASIDRAVEASGIESRWQATRGESLEPANMLAMIEIEVGADGAVTEVRVARNILFESPWLEELKTVVAGQSLPSMAGQIFTWEASFEYMPEEPSNWPLIRRGLLIGAGFLLFGVLYSIVL